MDLGGRQPSSGADLHADILHNRHSLTHVRARRNPQDRKGVSASDQGKPGKHEAG